jgi:hypothetical protein
MLPARRAKRSRQVSGVDSCSRRHLKGVRHSRHSDGTTGCGGRITGLPIRAVLLHRSGRARARGPGEGLGLAGVAGVAEWQERSWKRLRSLSTSEAAAAAQSGTEPEPVPQTGLVPSAGQARSQRRRAPSRIAHGRASRPARASICGPPNHPANRHCEFMGAYPHPHPS